MELMLSIVAVILAMECVRLAWRIRCLGRELDKRRTRASDRHGETGRLKMVTK